MYIQSGAGSDVQRDEVSSHKAGLCAKIEEKVILNMNGLSYCALFCCLFPFRYFEFECFF